MKNWIAKRLVTKYQPTVLFIMGSGGKTMLSHLLSDLLPKLEISAAEAQANSYSELFNKTAGDSSLRRIASSVLTNTSAPEVLIGESHEFVNGEKELTGLIENKFLLIPWVSDYNIQQAGNATKYLQKRCKLTKAAAKELTIIYNKDVIGLQEAIESFSPKKSLSVSARTEDADFKAFNPEFVKADDAHISNDHRIQGLSFKVKNGGATLPIRLNGVIGESYMYSTLIALLVIKELGLNQVDALPLLREFTAPVGRARLIPGIKKTLLVDDSYSSDAESAYELLTMASRIELEEGKRRIAVISDMLDYGADSDQAHCLLGDQVAAMNYDLVVGVGERSHDLLRCLHDTGIDVNHLHHFMDIQEAGLFVQHELRQGDLVVIKGDKEMKLEAIVKELMAFPLKAKEEILHR